MKYIVFIIMCLCLCTPAKAQTYDELIDKAMDAVEQDSLLQAENYFKEALRLEPANMRNSLLFSNLGSIQRRMGKRKEALESYSLALNKTPFSVTMLLNRASLLMEMNDLDRAYTDYCGVLDLDQKNPEALMFRAYIYMKRRQYQDARLDYRSYLEIDPGNKTARLGMALVNQKDKRYHESLEDFNRLIVDYPEDVSLLKARAELEIEMNSFDLALLDLENASKLAKDDPEIYVMCGDIYLLQNKKREAYNAFEKAIELGIPRPELSERLKASKKK
jgi:tetratricopeptide (TPR) repeat protein